jgi:ribonuclease HII
VKGDRLSFSIAAASILAKVERDRVMDDYHRHFPHYNFAQHKGYGTAAHREAIRLLGPCPAHRRTFRGVKEYCRN